MASTKPNGRKMTCAPVFAAFAGTRSVPRDLPTSPTWLKQSGAAGLGHWHCHLYCSLRRASVAVCGPKAAISLVNRYLSPSEAETNLKTLPARVVVTGSVAIAVVLLGLAIAAAGFGLADYLSK